MKPSKSRIIPTNIRILAEKHDIIPDEKPLKFSEAEILSLIDKYISRLETRLEKAKKIYREQAAEIKGLRSPELWTFGVRREAPPDFKEEYLRRILNKNTGETSKEENVARKLHRQ